MLVTFVSECEKKALIRTRRVLDSFANRIGSNVWQTPITMEGLEAVEKLLKQTASKNTAISCHQLKSRIRTKLLWVIGNKKKFNQDGITPVNWTKQDKFIGEINMSEIYANTNKQTLDEHLFGVGIVSQEIMKSFTDDIQLQKAAFIAGCWHDIGKLEIHFQDWLNKELKKKNLNMNFPDNGFHIEKGSFSFEKYPTHNEVSVLIYQLLADDSSFGKPIKEAIKHSIYWHHPKPFRKDEISSLNQVAEKLKDCKLETLIQESKNIFKCINELSKNYPKEMHIETKTISDFQDEIDDVKLPQYKTYETSENISSYQLQIKKNATKSLIRSSVITADRLISSLSGDELKEYIDNKGLEDFVKKQFQVDNKLSKHIQTCLDGFNTKYPDSERNKQQSKVVKDLLNKDIDVAVLSGPAGCGKTKIALEWALKTSAKKILWVCPRVAICQSLFKDLSSSEYLPSVNIEIHTGEFKFNNKKNELKEDEYFSGDIVLTTIDQIVNSITTHKNITVLTNFMNSTVVFDEFHEYAQMSGFNILFAELIKCKKMQHNDESFSNTLLVSATPNFYFVKTFLDIDIIKSIDSFNEKLYKIELIDFDESKEDESNPLYKKVDEDTFVISNTAITAQKSFIHNQKKENSLLIHSKFTKKDKKEIFKLVLDNFSQDSNRQIGIVRSGPIIQASLNISCSTMISEISNAENTLQRLGRLNRFGELEEASLQILITDGVKSGKQNGSIASFLGRNFQLQNAKAWFEFLAKKLEDCSAIRINDLYNWYEEFYSQDSASYILKIEEDFIGLLKKSIIDINNNIFDPLRVKLSKNSIIKLKEYSLRGKSRFVQMAIYDTVNNQILDEYLTETMTLSIDEIEGYGNSKDGILSFMKKKHHNIMNCKKAFNNNELKNNARDPEKPIYVSYKPTDLKTIEAKAEDDSIYYLRGINQPIGTMAITKFIVQ